MTVEEKQLIENLFSRLYQTEIELPSRDNDVEQLIRSLLKKQEHAVYYMAQTILVQETVIKKLNDQISVLKNELSIKNEDNKVKNSSFLSSLFNIKKKSIDFRKSKFDSENNKNSAIPGTDRSYSNLNDVTSSSLPKESFNGNHNNSSQQQANHPTQGGGFLSGALQTAAGVAGGMVMANLLTNLFQHKKPEEEIINQINNIEPAVQISEMNHSQNVDDNENSEHMTSLLKEDVISDKDDDHKLSHQYNDDNHIIDNQNEEQYYNSNNYNVDENSDTNDFDDDNFI